MLTVPEPPFHWPPATNPLPRTAPIPNALDDLPGAVYVASAVIVNCKEGLTDIEPPPVPIVAPIGPARAEME